MTQLYLISPPTFELADFSKQLQAALLACHPRESGDPEPNTKSPQIPAQGGDDALYTPPARVDTNRTHPICGDTTLTHPACGGGKGGAGAAAPSDWIEPSPNPSRKREGNISDGRKREGNINDGRKREGNERIYEPAGESAMSVRSAASCQSQKALAEAKQHLVGAFQLRLKGADDSQIRAAIKELLPICREHEVAFMINDRVDLCLELQLDGVHLGQEDLLHYPSSLSLTHPANPTSSTPPACGGGKGGAVAAAPSDWIEPSPNPSRKREGNINDGRKREGNINDGRKREGNITLPADDAIRKIRARLSDDMALGITCHASKHLAMEAAEAGADYVAFGAFYPTTSKPKEKLEKWGTPTPDILAWWTEVTEIPCVAIGGITPQNCTPLMQAGADFIAVITSIWNFPDGPKAAIRAFEQAMQQVISAKE